MSYGENLQNDPNTELLKYGLKYEQTSSGFKVKSSTGGEFFPNRFENLILISFFIVLFAYPFLFSKQLKNIELYLDNHPFGNIIGTFLRLGILCIIFFVGYYFYKMTSTETEYLFSNSGININSKKGSLFISRDNIDEVVIKEKEESTKYGKYYYYQIILHLKTDLYIPATKQSKREVNLFKDIEFKEDIIFSQTMEKMKNTLELQ